MERNGSCVGQQEAAWRLVVVCRSKTAWKKHACMGHVRAAQKRGWRKQQLPPNGQDHNPLMDKTMTKPMMLASH